MIDILERFKNDIKVKQTTIGIKALQEINEGRIDGILYNSIQNVFEISCPYHYVTQEHCRYYGIKKPKKVSNAVFNWIIKEISKTYNMEFIYKDVKKI